MGVDVDRKTFETNIREALKNKTFKVNVEANKNIKKAAVEANKSILSKSINDFLRDETFKANVELVVKKASVQQAIREAFAQAGLRYDTTASDARQNLIDTRTAKTNAYVEAQRALAELRRAQAASAQAANQQADAMERVNRAGERQKGVMATVREQVANAYALYRVGRFLEGVIRISGEFQQQHVALQTILGDAQKADVLFARIKNLAVESPFKFGDLTGYAKQLAAFSIPYEELFDTLKRFGDLSAGLGVDMGRIILAYGQVRSAEFLKGTELRQFTEAGIPLVAELARRYTELEGTLVSVGDVYDRISKKQVAFSDVKAVLWDLTSEGGRFFNMQAELTDTLKGKLDKLIDSYEIFLSEVGNSNNEALGGTLDLLTSILGHWREIQNAIMAVTAAYGTYKAVLISINAIQKTSIKLDVIQKAITSMQFLGKATNGVSAAFKLLGGVISKNPIVLFAGVLASMVGALVMMKSESESTADVITELNAKIQEEAEMTDMRKQKASDMATIMTNEKKSIEERSKAYDTLVSIYPTIFDGMSREQAMLMDELRLRNKIIDAAKEESKEKLKANLVDLDKKIAEAKRKRDTSSIMYDRFGNQVDLKSTKQKKQEAQAVVDLETERLMVLEKIAAVEKQESELQAQRTARWYTESKRIAEEAGLKSLIPTDKETDVWEYFDRIKQGMDDINKKKSMLNPKSENYSTMLGNLDDELKAYEKIYYGVLGGKNEEALKAAEQARKERERKAAEEAKLNKKLGEEAAKAYAEGVKAEMRRISSQWDLYKELFELTGDKVFASTAFSTVPVWDEAANQMYEKFEKALEAKGFDGTISFGISDALAKEYFGELYDSWKEIKDRIEKNGIDLKVNVADIVKNSKDFDLQLKAVYSELEEKIQALQKSGLAKSLIDRHTAELTREADEKVAKIQFEEFKKSSDWVKVFDDLNRASNSTLDNMITKVEEFAKQAHLSEEVTKQLVEAMAKLRKEAIERNPFKGFEDAWKRLKYFKGLSSKVGEYDEHGKLITQQMVDDGIAEANDDLEKSSLAVADKFQAVANAADLLSGIFDGLGIDLGGLKDVLGGIAGGAQSGAGIAAAFGATGPWGAIAGAAVGLLSSVFAQHDKALQKEIEASEAREKAIKNMADNLEAALSKNLGGIYSMKMDDETRKELEDLKNAISLSVSGTSIDIGFTHSNETRRKLEEALSEDSVYDAQLASLMAQRDELQEQMELENEKKNADGGKIADYEQAIKDMDIAIEDFARDMADALYGIDFKDWASQLSEAIVNAWANGEAAVKAYKDTVDEILRDLGVSIITQKIIAPMLEDTMNEFYEQFGKDNGVITDASMEILTGMYAEAEQAAKATSAYLEALEKMGIDVKDMADESSSELSKGVQSVTEDTANLVASYLNAVRGDVSVNRTLIEQLVNVSVPRMSMIAEAQLQQLQMVVVNTKRNADAADRIYELVNRVVDKGSNKLKV